MNKTKLKTENGITLIALIITIIILVILAAVSVRAVYNMGIVNHAINGTREYSEAAKDEQQKMDEISEFLENTHKNLRNTGGNEQAYLFQTDGNGYITGFKEEYITYSDSGYDRTCTVDIETLTIPNKIENETIIGIKDGAFSYFNDIKSVIISNGITSIGYDAFYYCDNLTNITIPNSVTSIGKSAFFGCTSLTSVTIPDSVTYIGFWAFGNVPHIYYNGTASGSPWGAKAIN